MALGDVVYWLWIFAPAIVAVGTFIGFLANGAKTPWERGWEVTMPFLACIPSWGAIASQWHASRKPDAPLDVKRWEGFPGTVHAFTFIVILAWSVSFLHPDAIGTLAKPRVQGEILASGCDGKGHLKEPKFKSNDVARITFQDLRTNGSNSNWFVRYHNCYECTPNRFINAARASNTTLTMYVAHGFDLSVKYDDGADGPMHSYSTIADQGEYLITLSDDQSLSLKTLHDPWPSEAPVLIAAALLIALALARRVLVRVADRWLERPEPEGSEDDLLPGSYPEGSAQPSATVAAPGRKGNRLLALDVFRGISLTVMNVANYGGMGYWWWDHSKWDGVTVADLVFPWFIWIMGVAMAMALEGARVREDKFAAVLHVLRRAALLVLVAMWLGAQDLDSFRKWRIPGVLQRFALSYLVVAAGIILVYKKPAKKLQPNLQEGGSIPDGMMGSLFSSSAREAPFFLILVGLWLAVSLGSTKPPGCPQGYLGPGGTYKNSEHFNCTGGVARWLDEKVFGEHRWGGCFPCDTYSAYDLVTRECQSPPHHDPEGLLGSLNSIVLCWLGVVVGRVVRSVQGGGWEVQKWAGVVLGIFGSLLCLIAALLCGFKQFDGFGGIPLNKNLWSLSFICLMAGTGTLFLTVLLYIIDWRGYWEGKPFLFVGMNSMLYYCMHEILQDYAPLVSPKDAGGDGGGTKQAQVVRCVIAVSINVIVVYWLWRNKLFLKL